MTGRHELAQPLRDLADVLVSFEDHPAFADLSNPANLVTAAAHALGVQAGIIADQRFAIDQARGVAKPFTTKGKP